jgi:16S rRNA (uracil1498-N3)-methyltransferase
MARRRFFVPEVRRGLAELTGTDAEHLVRVLRAEVGRVYEISDNQNLYLAQIEVARKSLVSFRVTEKLPVAEPAVHITLLPAVFKFDRFEWLVEKATELGVDTIQPFEAARTEHGLAHGALKRVSRWEKIALEASQQSRRAHLPAIEKPCRFTQALATSADLRLLLDEAIAPPITALLPSLKPAGARVALLLGPEGGWTDEERSAANAAGWLSGSLGPATLRAETAGVAALAVIQTAWLPPQREPDRSLPAAE